MEYGILVAISDSGEYQIVGAVDSLAEARSMAHGYLLNAAEYDMLCPINFRIDRRNASGFYAVHETVRLNS